MELAAVFCRLGSDDPSDELTLNAGKSEHDPDDIVCRMDVKSDSSDSPCEEEEEEDVFSSSLDTSSSPLAEEFEVTEVKREDKDIDQLQKVLNESIERQTITPLIKQELRFKIQNRRLSQGMGELKVAFEQPKEYPLTPEEELKIEVRKLRNRQSADSSRKRRKEYEDLLNKEKQALEDDNSRLAKDIEALRKFKKILEAKFSQHLLKCRRKSDENEILKKKRFDSLPKDKKIHVIKEFLKKNPAVIKMSQTSEALPLAVPGT